LAGNHADASDATQEALLAVVRGLPRFDGRAAFSTWSYRVATNACLDELRRRRRRPDPGLPDDDTLLGADPAGPIDDVVIGEMTIDAALQELPPDFRAAVVLRDVCSLDYAEIAEVLGVPPGTVRSRIARGRALLAARLGGNPQPASDRPTPEP
jgi:RNA polymerase sigma-70 factor (ECF subfamily)